MDDICFANGVNEVSEIDDIRFAVQIHAEDHDIHDEHLVDKLFDEFKNNNYDSVEDILEHTFDKDILSITGDHVLENIDYSIEGLAHITNVANMNSFRNVDTYEQINNRQQNLLMTQLHINQAPQNANPLQGLFNQFANAQNNSPIQNIFGGMLNAFLNVPLQQNIYDPVMVTLTQEALDKLVDMTYEQVVEKLPNLDNDEKCAICWSKLEEKIEDLEYYKILPCNHVFHSECIVEELANYSYTCPICKDECGEHEAKIDN